MIVKPSRSWMYEAPLFYLALAAIQRGAFPADPAFRSLNPSPLWLGILLFSLRYGIGAGLGSGVLASLFHALGAKLAGEGFLLADADFYVTPGLFVVVGAALGAVAEKWRHRFAGLTSKLHELTNRNRGLLDQIQAQQKAMRAVEQQVVSQMSSVVTLYHGSRELGTLDRRALLPAMLEFFTRALDATKTGLYLPDDGGWKALDTRGWDSDSEFPRRVASGEGVVGRAASEARVVTLKDALAAASTGQDLKEAEAVMAAPILDPEGKPAAVFAVHAMPFLRFNTASVNLLALLVEWGSESLAKCVEVERLKERSLLDEELGVHSGHYVKARLEQEFAGSRRFALPTSLLLLRVDPAASVPAERLPALVAATARALRETARDIDIVARCPFEGGDLAVLLPTTTRERAVEARDKIFEALGKLELPAKIKAGVGSYAPGMTSAEDMVGEARNELR